MYSVSLHFDGQFAGGPGIADTRMASFWSSFWILLELRMIEMVVTNGAMRRAKLHSNHHHQQSNSPAPDFLQAFKGWMPFLSPNQQYWITEGNNVKKINYFCSIIDEDCNCQMSTGDVKILCRRTLNGERSCGEPRCKQ